MILHLPGAVRGAQMAAAGLAELARLSPKQLEQASTRLRVLHAEVVADVPAPAPRPRYLLVGCGAQKAPHPCAARELYTGSLFQAARKHAEASKHPWRVLSAEHGLLDPDTVIAPYNRRLPRSSEALATLSCRISYQLLALRWSGGVVEVHAGRAYVNLVRIAARLRGLDIQVECPLDSLGLGHRLAWYRAQRGKRVA